tara:strand:+ start:152807 stop:153985 length:1179 start_codon:yes stop_codon:yes gene_type:complete
MTQGICILGATGSIGQNTLKVIAKHPEQFHIEALTANTAFKILFEQCLKFQPKFAVMANDAAAKQLKDLLDNVKPKLDITVLSGEQALIDVAALASVDKVMSAIVGAKGLLPTLSAIKAGKTVLIANKEPLVMAGSFMLDAAQKYGATVLPVDSEHNAIFQCLPDNYQAGTSPKNIYKVHLTASGGPFLNWDIKQFSDITPTLACDHPTWDMGPKISVDSATLMNKGLEVIEACYLFGLSPDQIQVVIHPESIVHSLVEYIDGSYLAQMGSHDMRVAIAHSLAWPKRMTSGAPRLDLFSVGQLNFSPPDTAKFRCLALAFEALKLGGAAPAILNASNEVAVHAFLTERVRFDQIPAMIESVLNKYYDLKITSIEDAIYADQLARQYALSLSE